MNLTELQTFLAIIKTGSLVRASEELNVTQSTVTARLRSLEDALGQVLVNRQKSGATLTGAGVRLHRYANTINDLWRQARQETALPDATNAVCNIGCHPDLWSDLTERFFTYLRDHHPGVALSVWLGGESELDRWLSEGLCDIAFRYEPRTTVKQQLIELEPDKLILVSDRPDTPHKFDPGYVFVEAGEEFGRAHATAYADANSARISFGTADLGLRYILENGGSAYLPFRIAAPFLQAGRLYQIDQAPIFTRQPFICVNSTAAATWPWFTEASAAVQHSG